MRALKLGLPWFCHKLCLRLEAAAEATGDVRDAGDLEWQVQAARQAPALHVFATHTLNFRQKPRV